MFFLISSQISMYVIADKAFHDVKLRMMRKFAKF